MKQNQIEILSPAGSYETFVCAVNCGADAVYIGGQSFNARKNAVNFSNEEILNAVEYAHLHSKKVYVTLNTLVSDLELRQVYDFVSFLYDAGVDALIIQDLAVINIVKTYFPDFEVHASTQMTVCNVDGARIAKELGFKRVVLARELTFEEIKAISDSVDIELEVFVHGALCMSYSGQCLMSSFLGSRSGNRGACAQPCRLPYTLCDANGKAVSEKDKYLLSLKDLCLVDEMEKLISCGVKSIKIEGRMKSSDYVSIVTSVYDKYRFGGKVDCKDMAMLENIFSRNGFTKGYPEGKTGRHMLNYDRNNDDVYRKISADVRDSAQRLKEKTLPKIPFDVHFEASLSKAPVLKVNAVGHSVCVTGNTLCEKAINIPLAYDRVLSQLSKTGNTQFELREYGIDIEDNISLPIKEINELRRKALEKLTHSIAHIPRKGKTGEFKMPDDCKKSDKHILCARVVAKEQAVSAIDAGFDKILVPYSLYTKEKDYFDLSGKDIAVVLPNILHSMADIDVSLIKGDIYATNISHLSLAERFSVRADFTLNIFNSLAFDTLKRYGIKSVCISSEANMKEILNLKTSLPLEVIVYGKVPLMTVKNCVIKSSYGKCSCTDTVYYLKDRKGAFFPVTRDKINCTNTIYNSTPVYMADKWKEIASIGAYAHHFIFTDETPKEIKEIYNSYKNKKEPSSAFTRGHYYRGV